MGKLLEGVLEYLNNATEEQLQQDWEELKESNEIGPSMEYLIEESFSLLNTDINILQNTVLYDNPDYSNPKYNLAA